MQQNDILAIWGHFCVRQVEDCDFEAMTVCTMLDVGDFNMQERAEGCQGTNSYFTKSCKGEERSYKTCIDSRVKRII
jgi:hypothetical protein